VRLYWPDRVERITGVPENDIVAAARMLASADRAMILTARGAEQHSSGTDTVQAFINLALALGLPGRPYSGSRRSRVRGTDRVAASMGRSATSYPATAKSTTRSLAPILRRYGASIRPTCQHLGFRHTRC